MDDGTPCRIRTDVIDFEKVAFLTTKLTEHIKKPNTKKALPFLEELKK